MTDTTQTSEAAPVEQAQPQTPAQETQSDLLTPEQAEFDKTTSEITDALNAKAADKPTDKPAPPEWVPKKFINKDGTPDFEKLAKSYAELERTRPTPAEDLDFMDEEVSKNELDWGKGEHAEQWRGEVMSKLKEAKLTKPQIETVLQLHGKAVKNLIGQVGVPVDIPQQVNTLKEAWGTNFTENQIEASNYLRSLAAKNPDLLHYPLHKTAAGLQFALQLARAQEQPEFIRNNDMPLNVGDLQAELQKTVQDPAYRAQNPVGEQLRNKAMQIADRIEKAKGRK